MNLGQLGLTQDGVSKSADPKLLRDIGLELCNQTLEALEKDHNQVVDIKLGRLGKTTFGGIVSKLGYVVTAYDVVSECNSNATREERLIELTTFIATAELGAKVNPSTEHTYLKIPNFVFESAQEAQDRLNTIYHALDNLFSNFDLTDDNAYEAARIFIEKTPNLYLTAEIDLILKAPSKNKSTNGSENSSREGAGSYEHTRNKEDVKIQD